VKRIPLTAAVCANFDPFDADVENDAPEDPERFNVGGFFC
jgi:hypothetical protein